MEENKKEESRKIYVLLTQTGTFLSRFLKFFTKDRYNHSSIAMDDELNEIYSFGRLNPYNPFIGGFVRESPDYGTFKRFYKTTGILLELDISAEKYEKTLAKLRDMYNRREEYKYNYKGLFASFFGVVVEKQHRYYCSEFVKKVLIDNELINPDDFSGITAPADFLNIPDAKVVWQGVLADYPNHSGELTAALT